MLTLYNFSAMGDLAIAGTGEETEVAVHLAAGATDTTIGQRVSFNPDDRETVPELSPVERAATRVAMAAAKQRGQRVGHLPYGWQLADDGRTLVVNDDEQGTLRLVRRLRGLGYAQLDIANELNRLGFRTRRGGPFQRSFIAQLLHRHPAVS
jgi:hypothetical protein